MVRNDLLYHKVALGDGAGLIHNDGLNVIQCFQRSAALEQDTASGACADAGVGQRYAGFSAHGREIARRSSRCRTRRHSPVTRLGQWRSRAIPNNGFQVIRGGLLSDRLRLMALSRCRDALYSFSAECVSCRRIVQPKVPCADVCRRTFLWLFERLSPSFNLAVGARYDARRPVMSPSNCVFSCSIDQRGAIASMSAARRRSTAISKLFADATNLAPRRPSSEPTCHRRQPSGVFVDT